MIDRDEMAAKAAVRRDAKRAQRKALTEGERRDWSEDEIEARARSLRRRFAREREAKQSARLV